MARTPEKLTSRIPTGKDLKIAIVVSEWNDEITGAMLKAAVARLEQQGVKKADIMVRHVPGSFEIPLGAQLIAQEKKPDAVICLGCVINGETRHFDYVCQGVTQGIAELNLKFTLPFIFGILTTDNINQARERAGGSHGNKGDEAAITALKMIALRKELER